MPNKRLNARHQVLAQRVACATLRNRMEQAPVGSLRNSLEQKLSEYLHMESQALESYANHSRKDLLALTQQRQTLQEQADGSETYDLNIEEEISAHSTQIKQLIAEAKELNLPLVTSPLAGVQGVDIIETITQ